jgi:dCMP deaminase
MRSVEKNNYASRYPQRRGRRFYKDGRPENSHPLNRGPQQKRIPLFEAYLRFAEVLSLRSTDGIQKVGCVIVSFNLERVLGIGYNGGASGIDDSLYIPDGRSGYIHAEMNALIKTGALEKDKIMFVTHAPCSMCAKAAINSGISYLYYRQDNVRGDRTGLELLERARVRVIRYTCWEEEDTIRRVEEFNGREDNMSHENTR